MQISECEYGGWKRNLRLSTGSVEIIVTLDVGPRILRCGFVGQQNLFAELGNQLGGAGEGRFMMRGGHRFWAAPESSGFSADADNSPVSWTRTGEAIQIASPPSPLSGLSKELQIQFEDEEIINVRHTLTNTTGAPVTCAPWALTAMPPWTECIVPFGSFVPQSEPGSSEPSQRLIFWPYTDIGDSRLQLSTRYLRFLHSPHRAKAWKCGLNVIPGWVAGIRSGQGLVKRFEYDPAAVYPDGNVNFEMYVGFAVIEIESLGAMQLLQPAGCISHTERWRLVDGLPSMPTDATVDEQLARLAAF